MSTEAVQLIFQIQAQNTAALAGIRQSVSGLNTTLQEQLKLTSALVLRSTEQIRQNNEIISAIKGRTAAQQQNNDTTSQSIIKGLLYSEVLLKVVGAIKEITVESTLYAARTQQLNVIMDQLAKVNGLSVPAVRATADAIKGLGITTQESRSVINQMIFAQLDLSKATDLARLAQNAAKIAGVSSSEALSGIVNGIVEQRVQILRTYGIQVQFEQALIRGAAQLGKTRETLTDYERSNIALNEVLSKGPRIFGAYEVSLSTASGQMQSMKRYIDEAKNALGEGFIPVLQRVIDLLTDGTKSVSENAEAYQSLAKHITAASLAIAAAKLVPGSPAVKLAVGAAVGAGAEIFLDVNAVEQQQKFSQEAIKKIESERLALTKKYQKGGIADKEDYIKQDKQLKDLEIQIEQNFTETLAQIYGARQKKFQAQQVAHPQSKFSNAIGFEDGLTKADRRAATPPETIDLGAGIKVTRQQIDAAIADLGKAPTIKPGDLTIHPDLAGQFDAILGQFTSKVKEAQKSTQAGLDRARESLLNGPEKIEAERKAALDKLQTDFQQFIKVFNDTIAHAGEVKDEKSRKALLQEVGNAQGQYGVAVRRINDQFDLEQIKAKREDAVKEINRNKRVDDARDDAAIQRTRQVQAGESRVTAASRSFVQPGQEQSVIQQSYQERIDAAKTEYDYAKKKAQTDLDAAKLIYDQKKDDDILTDAATAKTIADIKAEAQLTKEKSEAEIDKTIQLIDLRKKVREQIQLEVNLAREISSEEVKVGNQRNRDQANRAVQLASAQATPGNEQYATNVGISARVKAAKEDYDISQANIAQQRQAAQDLYINGGSTQKDLETTIANLRKQSLQDAYTLEKSILDARLDKELQIAEIRKQQDQQLRSTIGQIFDTLASHKPFTEFLRDYGRNVLKQLTENVGAEVFRGSLQQLGGIIPGQQKIDPITGKPTGELSATGRILQGTPLGIDPVKLAQAQQVSALDRNTKALQDLNGNLNGAAGSVAGASGGIPSGSGGQGTSGGGFGGILGRIGGILTGGANSGMIIKNYSNGGFGPSSFLASQPTAASYGGGSGIDFSPDQGIGGAVSKLKGIFTPKIDPNTGKPGFSTGNTALAAAAAIPDIIKNVKQGGVSGVLGGIGDALGVAASIPSPATPFLAAGAAALSLIAPLLGKSKFQKWQDNLNNRLSSKFYMPDSINLTQDLSGNNVDFDYRGNLRTSAGQSSNNFAVSVQTMDAKSFMDNAPQIAEASRAAIQMGHPLKDTIQGLAAN